MQTALRSRARISFALIPKRSNLLISERSHLPIYSNFKRKPNGHCGYTILDLE